MKRGLAASITFHAAILAAALVGGSGDFLGELGLLGGLGDGAIQKRLELVDRGGEVAFAVGGFGGFDGAGIIRPDGQAKGDREEGRDGWGEERRGHGRILRNFWARPGLSWTGRVSTGSLNHNPTTYSK